MNFFDKFQKKHIIIAHRGYRSKMPENTIFAFKKALNHADMFEFDVQFTKDKVPIIMHDVSLLRTTNAKKVFPNKKSYNVESFTFEEIKKLDNISWFIKQNPYHLSQKELEEIMKLPKNSIPTLKETLVFIKKYNFPANLEIKHSFFSKIKTVQIICKMISDLKIENLIIISSFNHEYLKIIKKLCPKLQTAALFEKKRKNLTGYLKSLKVSAYHTWDKIVDIKTVKHLLKHNIYTNVYTVNDKKRKEFLFSHKIKGIFTDFADI